MAALPRQSSHSFTRHAAMKSRQLPVPEPLFYPAVAIDFFEGGL
jgi:hypothetical protein